MAHCTKCSKEILNATSNVTIYHHSTNKFLIFCGHCWEKITSNEYTKEIFNNIKVTNELKICSIMDRDPLSLYTIKVKEYIHYHPKKIEIRTNEQLKKIIGNYWFDILVKKICDNLDRKDNYENFSQIGSKCHSF